MRLLQKVSWDIFIGDSAMRNFSCNRIRTRNLSTWAIMPLRRWSPPDVVEHLLFQPLLGPFRDDNGSFWPVLWLWARWKISECMPIQHDWLVQWQSCLMDIQWYQSSLKLFNFQPENHFSKLTERWDTKEDSIGCNDVSPQANGDIAKVLLERFGSFKPTITNKA